MRLLADDESGRPAGFANVEFSSAEEAQNFYKAAVDSALSFYGRNSRVELVEEAQTQVLRGRAKNSIQASNPTATIFIGRLPEQANEDEIRELFSPYGTILRASIGTLLSSYGYIISCSLSLQPKTAKVETVALHM